MDRLWLAGRELSRHADFRLFCLPYAGGGASAFRAWVAAAPRRIQVCPVELPGRGTRLREAPYLRLRPLVRALADGLTGALDRPYAIFGHSMGGLVAFELVRELRRRGLREPERLFVSAMAAPGVPPAQPYLHCAPEDQVRHRLREMSGTPPELLDHAELMEVMIPVVRADFSLVETYEHREEPPLAVPLTVLGGRSDPVVPPKALDGWRRHSAGGCRLHLFPGDHFFLHSAAAEVLAAIVGDIEVPSPA